MAVLGIIPAADIAAATLTEPMYYVGEGVLPVVARRAPALERYAACVPCWVPHRAIAEALGYGTEAIDAAAARFGNYLWASEFENVHTTWPVVEPGFTFNNVAFRGSEQLFQACKVGPVGSAAFADAAPRFAAVDAGTAFAMGRAVALRADWELAKDDAMVAAVRAKFTATGAPVNRVATVTGDELLALLLSTGDHPLVAVKGDWYWGAGTDAAGDNRLPTLLMQLRQRLRA